eukprot:2473362-Rhodomonas_salina.1
MIASASKGESTVQQMIMGSGKSTVIAPLLSLFLSSSKQMVLQVVPDSLLQQSRDIMSAVFGNVLTKRVQTFRFDRRITEPKRVADLLQGLEDALEHQAVVCTTPGSIKSLFLKFLEVMYEQQKMPSALGRSKQELLELAEGDGLEEMDQETLKTGVEILQAEVENAERATCLLQKIVQMFSKGIAIVDEVDWVLDPLKSETNFPIGTDVLCICVSVCVRVCQCVCPCVLRVRVPGTPGSKLDLDLAPERWLLPMHLIDGIMFASGHFRQLSLEGMSMARVGALLTDMAAAIAKGYTRMTMQRKPHLILLDRNFYAANLMPVVAKWALVWLAGQPAIENALLLCEADGRTGGQSEVKKAIREYISGRSAAKTKLEEVFGTQPRSMAMLNLARSWV